MDLFFFCLPAQYAVTRSLQNDLVDQFKNRAEQKITERGQETCKLYTNSLYTYILYKYILYTYISYILYILKHIMDREGVENKYVNYTLGEHPTPNPTLLLRHNKVIKVPVYWNTSWSQYISFGSYWKYILKPTI